MCENDKLSKKCQICAPLPMCPIIPVCHLDLCIIMPSFRKIHGVSAKIHVEQGCIHLNLLGMSQNFFATARFIVSSNAMKKNSDHLTPGAANQKSHKPVPHFCPSKDFIFFFKFFVWTKVYFVEPLIAPVLDFMCPSSWVSNPEWISCLHSFLLACCDPEGHIWCDTCLFHQ